MRFFGFELRRARESLDKIKPKSIGLETGEEIERVPPDKLELVYATDPIIFNAVNVYVEVMLSCDPEIICDSPKDQRYMDEWQRRVKFKSRVLPKVVQHCCIYGNSFVEICYSKKLKTEIVKLSPRDPKYMDFRRVGLNNQVKFDEFGEPEAYVQYLEFWHPKQPNEIMQAGRRAIVIPKDKIVHTTFLTVGDSYYGIGLIEPCYNAAIMKNNAMKGFAHSVFRLGYPIFGVEVGNDKIYPTPNMIDEAFNAFKEINERTLIAHPNWMKPYVIESKSKAERLREHVKLFIDEEVAGLGVPKALVTGSGEETNRAVLDTMLTLFYQKIKMFQDSISASYEEQLFYKIYEDKNLDTVPRLEWKETSIESLSAKAERIERYIKSGVLKPYKQLEESVKEWERLPKGEDASPGGGEE